MINIATSQHLNITTSLHHYNTTSLHRYRNTDLNVPYRLFRLFTVNDNNKFTQAAGLCGIVVALVVPSLLQRQLSFRGSLITVSMTSIIPLDTQFNQQIFSTGALFLAGLAMAVCVFHIVYQ
jgi:hypothetical protein